MMNPLTLPVEKAKRTAKPPRQSKPKDTKELARAALGRFLDNPTSLGHWHTLMNCIMDVELQARLAELLESGRDGE
ncbi:hypothetical protein [Caballeronia sp. ATUFL_M1_KS5A]|uniref:hypothetical protein n=1 Tax=Caballeronia sp. ATUFL_M1_KS5A TaxID=2921778 RepID=UPI00202773BD|nr:hypothetical protein [Caballeronia sp. ATUFL_M1_KS5A]